MFPTLGMSPGSPLEDSRDGVEERERERDPERERHTERDTHPKRRRGTQREERQRERAREAGRNRASRHPVPKARPPLPFHTRAQDS